MQARGEPRPSRDSGLPVLAGWWSIAWSATLAVIVLVREVDFNVLNLWTIVGGATAGALVVAPWSTRAQADRWQLAAGVVLPIAMVPALVGGLGWLYLPSALVFWVVWSEPRRDAERSRS